MNLLSSNNSDVIDDGICNLHEQEPFELKARPMPPEIEDLVPLDRIHSNAFAKPTIKTWDGRH